MLSEYVKRTDFHGRTTIRDAAKTDSVTRTAAAKGHFRITSLDSHFWAKPTLCLVINTLEEVAEVGEVVGSSRSSRSSGKWEK